MNIDFHWPHSPLHCLHEESTYMVTGATFNKLPIFKNNYELDVLQNLLLELAKQYKWQLKAWAILVNHYHFIGKSPENPKTLIQLIKHFHSVSSREINRLQETPGRKVWYQYWESKISYHNSYMARLKYVMTNPVKHGLVENASEYRWCSAHWFEKNESKAFCQTVYSFPTDKLNIADDF